MHKDSPNVSEVALNILVNIACTQPQQGAKHVYFYLLDFQQSNSINDEAV